MNFSLICWTDSDSISMQFSSLRIDCQAEKATRYNGRRSWYNLSLQGTAFPDQFGGRCLHPLTSRETR